MFGRIETDGKVDKRGGEFVEIEIPHPEIDFYASRLLSVGTDVRVESPPELIEAMCDKAREVAQPYC